MFIFVNICLKTGVKNHIFIALTSVFLVRIFAASMRHNFRGLLKGADVKLKIEMERMNAFEKKIRGNEKKAQKKFFCKKIVRIFAA